MTSEQTDRFRDAGYLVVEEVLTAAEVEVLKDALGRLERDGDRDDVGLGWSEQRITTIHGLPLRPGPLSRVLQYRPVLDLVRQLIGGEEVRVTGGLLLDKTPESNWDIQWHQDSGIYVSEIPPGKPDDIRGGLPVLRTEGMELRRNVSCRIALDPSTAESGGLYLLPGSHKTNLGSNEEDREEIKRRFGSQRGDLAHQPPGSALFYCPLALHRSEKMSVEARRRILHLQYGPMDLRLPGAEPYAWPQPCPLTALESLVS